MMAPLFVCHFLERTDAMEEQLTDALLEKMQAEQEKYLAALRAMPPDEILNHAWEYTAREDVLMALASENLPIEQVQALLKSSSPLADIVKEYRDQDVDNERIFDAIEDAAKPNMEPPIYRQTFEYAAKHGEQDVYFASQKAYAECRASIDKAINSHFDGYYLGAGCMEEVINNFSPERVKNVLAYTVQNKEWDGRFSRATKAWAKSVDTEHMSTLSFQCTVNSHPAVLDGFISMFRREVLEQSQSEKSTEKVHQKPAERSDDFEL